MGVVELSHVVLRVAAQLAQTHVVPLHEVVLVPSLDQKCLRRHAAQQSVAHCSCNQCSRDVKLANTSRVNRQ